MGPQSFQWRGPIVGVPLGDALILRPNMFPESAGPMIVGPMLGGFPGPVGSGVSGAGFGVLAAIDPDPPPGWESNWAELTSMIGNNDLVKLRDFWRRKLTEARGRLKIDFQEGGLNDDVDVRNKAVRLLDTSLAERLENIIRSARNKGKTAAKSIGSDILWLIQRFVACTKTIEEFDKKLTQMEAESK